MGKKLGRFSRRSTTLLVGVGAVLLCGVVVFGQAAPDSSPAPSSLLVSQTPLSISDPPPATEESNDVLLDSEAPLPLPAHANEDAGATTHADTGVTGFSSATRRFHYELSATVRGVYDDNIRLTNTDQQSDSFVAIAPQIILGFGDFKGKENFVRVDYAPTVVIYTDHSEDNAVQQIFRLTGQYRLNRLTLGVIQGFDYLDGAETEISTTKDSVTNRLNLDVSGRTTRAIYTTHVNAAYDISEKSFLSAEGYYEASDYSDELISSELIGGDLYFNYRYSTKLEVGIGGSVGVNMVDEPSPDQTFEQANVRFTYDAGGKLSMTATGGIEFRQFEDSTEGTNISPVFAIGALYRPFDGTEISLDALRRVTPSAVLTEQNYTSTAINIGIRQRMLQRVFIGLSGGYQNSEYSGTTAAVNADRVDHYFFIEPSVDVRITRYMICGVFYTRRQNDTNDSNFKFENNQIGIRAAFKF